MADPAPTEFPFQYTYTPQLPALLHEIGASLLISSYQSGKLVVVREHAGAVTALLCPFEHPMGVAVAADRLALAARDQVWILRHVPEVPEALQPGGTAPEGIVPEELRLAGRHDGCFLPRSSHVTGDIRAHEIAWAGPELWIANTAFSCLATLHPDYSFVPRWQPPFISGLASEDRCHLNGLAVADGRPVYATALGETDVPQGWRPHKAHGGCLLDVASGAVVTRGLSMPHSPRLLDGRLWVLESGLGRVTLVDPASGQRQSVAELPGFTRGLDFHGRYAFVGLSRVRETSVFSDLPIAARRDELKCGVGVFDHTTGRAVALLEFGRGVEEIFDVKVLPGRRFPVILGFRHEAMRGVYVLPSRA